MLSLIQKARLEAECVHILHEADAEAENPLMLCSVNKNPSTMLRLARNVFHPAPPQFAMLPVTSDWNLVGLVATGSERQSRAIDKGQSASMEDKKQKWYF